MIDRVRTIVIFATISAWAVSAAAWTMYLILAGEPVGKALGEAIPR